MSAKKNLSKVTAIGVFVLAGAAILVGLLLAMGGNKWARETLTYRIFFNTSVKGLKVGAPVMFRGITIGQVNHINLAPQDGKTENEMTPGRRDVMPVEIQVEIYPETLGYPCEGFIAFLPHERHTLKLAHDYLGMMIKQNNMRAQLETLSILTGQIYISLNFLKSVNSEPEGLVNDLWANGIIPSSLSIFERISDNMDSEGLGKQLAGLKIALGDFTAFVEKGGLKNTLNNIQSVTEDAAVMSQELRCDLPQMKQEVSDAVTKLNLLTERLNVMIGEVQGDFKGTVQDTRRLVSGLNSFMDENRPDLQQLLKNMNDTVVIAQEDMRQAHAVLNDLHGAMAPGSPERKRLEDTIQEFDQMMVQLQTFIETLNHNPQALLLGR